MVVHGSPFTIVLVRMGMDNCITVNNMRMAEESGASEKFKKEQQEEPF